METCIACSMPLDDSKNIGGRISDGPVCVHCVSPDGGVKSCEEVFHGGVQFFMFMVPGINRDLAERLCRKNMNSLPYWQKNKGECLNGEEATEEEYKAALSKL